LEIQFVDFFLGHELVYLNCPLALNRNRLKLFRLKLQVFALADFVALDDVGGLDFVARLGVHLPIFDAIARLLVDLMKADFLSLTARWIKRDRTGDERQLQIAFPVSTGGHGSTPTLNAAISNECGSGGVPNPGPSIKG
jgi:hypothetical protein